jgi:MoaA/NifB/PqqE/SkfB family radical SAM enzyme
MPKKTPEGRVITVRLTTKCCYECKHCCFECGPKRTEVMSLDVAKQVRKTFEGHVSWLNVMGGEITLLPNYEELLEALHFTTLRIVTNGWWVDSEKARTKLVGVVRKLTSEGHPVYLGISRDRLHPAEVGDRAMEWLKSQVTFNDDWGFTATKNLEEEQRAIAPVGRAYWNELGDPILRMFSSYCHAHKANQSMTVLEDGSVTFCPFGAWPLGYLHWGFEELEATRERMSKVFIPNCVSCWTNWQCGGKQRALAQLAEQEVDWQMEHSSK